MFYTNAVGDKWHKYPNDIETFIDGKTTDVTITYPYTDGGYEQFHFECKATACDPHASIANWYNLYVAGTTDHSHTLALS